MEKIEHNRLSNVVLFCMAIAAILARLIWPSDAPFINDEPLFLDLGLKFSQTFDPFILGLKGKFGAQYGPFTSWFFGFLFLIIHNLIIMVFIKSLIVTAITLLSCWWLLKTLDFVKWEFIVPISTSLFLYIDARMLWDLNVPLTIMAMAAYASFMRYEKFPTLLLSVVMLIFAILTHLMCLPIVLAIFLHFVFFKLKWIKCNPGKLLTLSGILIVLAGPYFLYVLRVLMQAPSSDQSTFLEVRSLWYALMGARLFTTHDFSYFLGKNWQWVEGLPSVVNYLVTALAGVTWIAYPVSWVGLFRCVKIIFAKKLCHPKSSTLWDLKTQMMCLSMLIVFIHLLISFFGNLRGHPHYYNGSWPGILMMFWLGLDYLYKYRYFTPLYWCYLSVSILFLWRAAILVHDQGTRSIHYGPTIKNQIEVARTIRGIQNPEKIEYIAIHPKSFPHTFLFLQKLMVGPVLNPVMIESGVVDYANNNPRDGTIKITLE